ncbi:MAG TPA: molybdopterin-dependent oxidoreductase [Burkholderiaceae bacterium]|nr:molybdopterin-dependent oxidoreductase [Burkholderiaceae bacterium]HRZ02124.1 molybdopterin-dependent oxidoreductase [Burkholderiaceae bacterium]HRZ59919.1 molybdopterin-dependent oxidoreductase [Rubrivivax sp.]
MKSGQGLELTRREFVTAGAAVAASAGLGLGAGWPTQAQVKALEDAGYEKKPVTCFVCGAGCGLYAMHPKGATPGERNVLIVPNHDHPQRGYCGRGASAMWYWNHPLRLKKPLKRAGERGEGKFTEIEWGQALDEIAARLKTVVEKHGEKGVALTSHDLTSIAQFFGYALGTPNIVNHAATCQTAGTISRRWIFAPPYDTNFRVDPDYENARYVLFIGRTLQASMGAQSRLAQAKSRGARAVYVDPRMPEAAMADGEWVPIVPGTDTAFALALAQVILADKSYDAEFLAKYTTLPLLITADGMPVTQAQIRPKGDATLYAVWDGKRSAMAFVGAKRDEEGKAIDYFGDLDAEPALDYTGQVKLLDGTVVPVSTAFNALVARCAEYTPAAAAELTGVPAATITRIAREFASLKGVCDDSWYNARNGNDFDACRMMVILNALVGNIDKPGGLCFTGSAGVGSLVSLQGKTGEVKNALGKSWTITETKRIDTVTYPESNGTFDAVYTAMLEGKPYPVRALFTVGTTLFYRDANTERVKKALKTLDLLVVQDILPQEVCDYADYVLPASYFLERPEVAGVKWTLQTAIQTSEPVLRAPAGCQGRDDAWMLMEVLRRAYPDRAERAGWLPEYADYEKYRSQAAPVIEQARLSAALKRAAEKDPDAPEKIRKALHTQGYAIVAKKKYRNTLWTKPLETASGRMEVYALRGLLNEKLRAKTDPLPKFTPIRAYRVPMGPNEFYLVSGKNPANGSGTAVFGWPGKFVGDRSVWIHPADAERLRVADGQMIEIEGLDNGVKGQARAKVTQRVRPGVLFTYGFSAGYRGRLGADPRFAFMSEGVNTHWFATGYAEPVIGNMANNVSVRVSAA